MKNDDSVLAHIFDSFLKVSYVLTRFNVAEHREIDCKDILGGEINNPRKGVLSVQFSISFF